MTTDELDALPDGAVVLDTREGVVWQRGPVGRTGTLGWFPLEHAIASQSADLGPDTRVIAIVEP